MDQAFHRVDEALAILGEAEVLRRPAHSPAMEQGVAEASRDVASQASSQEAGSEASQEVGPVHVVLACLSEVEACHVDLASWVEGGHGSAASAWATCACLRPSQAGPCAPRLRAR